MISFKILSQTPRRRSERGLLSLSRERRCSRALTGGQNGQAGFSAIGLVVALAVVLALGLVGFWLFGGNENSTNSSSNNPTNSQTTTDNLNELNTQVSGLDTQLSTLQLASADYASLKLQVDNLVTTVSNIQLTPGPQGPIGATGAIGLAGPATTATCNYGLCLSLQVATPGTAETGSLNVSGTIIAGFLKGNGSNITNVDASYLNGFNAGYFVNATNISSGTLDNARLNTSVSLLGQTIANAELDNSSLTVTAGSGLSGGGTVSLGGTITLTATGGGVLSVTGTADQVTVNTSTGNVTFTLPQSIAVTSSPTFANLTITTNLSAGGTITAGSYTRSCPTGYVAVPGNPKFGTSDFCVMKYEAKNDGANNAVSTAAGTPYVNISQRTAQDKSIAAGGHLITEAEWMTIATNALWQNANWCDLNGANCNNAPGTANKYLAAGHNDNSPGAALEAGTDAQPCFGTVTAGVDTVCGANAQTQKRTLTLSNGSVIWDFPGNVWEWTDSWIIGDDQPDDAVVGGSGLEYTAVTTWKGLQYANPTNRGWNTSQRLGIIYTGYNGTTLYGFFRGGGWNGNSSAGAFALGLYGTPAGASSDIGFRVAR